MTSRTPILAILGVIAVLAVAPIRLAAQAPASRPLSLEDALTLAIPASENLEIARAAVSRARGEQYRAKADRYPQLGASANYNRLLRSQWEGFSFGGDSSSSGDTETDQLPFGQKNTYSLGLSLSQNVFTGGRLRGQGTAADAGRRSAELGVTAAESQLILDVVQFYYDAATADLQVRIAQIALEQADATLAQMEQRRAVGAQPEFDVLRARVARDNQRTALIARTAEREVAFIRLKQLLNLPIDASTTLATELADTAFADTPTLAAVVRQAGDSSAEARLVVRQAAEAVRAQEALAKVARSQQYPQLVLSSLYGNVGYPGNYDPFNADYFTNWNVSVGFQVPVFTGGRIKGDKTVADANVREARLRLQQLTELARVDARSTYANLDAARSAWDASAGTVQQAQRAYEIAELRFREGLSTQTELLDARLALQTAESARVEAARILQIARVRSALLESLPLAGTNATASLQQQQQQALTRVQQRPQAGGTGNGIPGTGITP
jgi:outer membrane protein TolC